MIVAFISSVLHGMFVVGFNAPSNLTNKYNEINLIRKHFEKHKPNCVLLFPGDSKYHLFISVRYKDVLTWLFY